MLLSNMLSNLLYKVVIGAPGVPAGYIPSNQGAARIQGSLNLMITIAIILATFYTIYAGLNYITSSGDPSKIKTAASSLQYGIIGVIVCVCAYLVVGIVAAVLGVQDTNLPF